MADSVIFVKCDKEEALRRIQEYCPGAEPIIDEDGDYEYRDVSIYEYDDDWTIMEDLTGEYFEENLVLALAENDDLFYVYVDEDYLDGELYALENGKIIRKLIDHYDKCDNENLGKLPYEEGNPLSNWIEIGTFLEYLYEEL